MNRGKYVFSQLMDFVPKYAFNTCVAKYKGNYRVRHFKCWQQFLCLSFGQLTHRESLRDIVFCLNAQHTKLYHLGFKNWVSRSTLSDANTKRNWRIYADFAAILMQEAQRLYLDEPELSLEISNSVYALDSSLIRLCVTLYKWANYRETTSGIKLHTLLDVQNAIPEMILITQGKVHDMGFLKRIEFKPYAFYIMDRAYHDLKQLYRICQAKAFFVVRAKINLNIVLLEQRSTKEMQNILCDQVVRFKNYYSRKAYPTALRYIKSKDPKTA